MLKVVHIDDSPAILRSFDAMLREIHGVELVGTAGDLGGAVRLIDAVKPQVVVLDVNLAHGDKGMDVLQYVLHGHPGTQVVMLTTAGSPKLRQIYLDAGAIGFFDKAAEFREACAWIAARELMSRTRQGH